MADVTLTLGVDTKVSLGNMRQEITAIMHTLNKQEYGIKIGLDSNSFKTMRSELQSVIRSLGNSTDGLGFEGFTSSIKELSSTASQSKASLDNIASGITEISAALQNMISALPESGSALSQMAKEGSTGIETLKADLQGLLDLVTQLNAKDFSVQNVFEYKQSGRSNTEEIELYRQKATELLGVVESLQDSLLKLSQSSSSAFSGALRLSGEFTQFFTLSEKYKGADVFSGDIASSTTLSSLQKIIAQLNEYYNVYSNIIGTAQGQGADVIIPDESKLQAASQQIDEYNSRAKQLEQTFTEAANAATKLTETQTQKSGSGTQDTPEYVEQIKSMCSETSTLLDELRAKIEQTFDLSTVPLNAQSIYDVIEQIKTQLSSLEINISASATKTVASSTPVSTASSGASSSRTSALKNTATAAKQASTNAEELRAKLASVNAALKEIGTTNSSITSSYKKLSTYLGGTTATGEDASQLDAMKSKYVELQTAVENLKASKATANQEDINNIYQLQTEMQGLMDTIQQRITAEQEASAAAQQAAKDEAAAIAQAAKENEANAKAQAKADAQAAKETAANQQLITSSYDKANSTLSRLSSALKNYSSAQNSSNESSRTAYSDIQQQYNSLQELVSSYDKTVDAAKNLKSATADANTILKESTATIQANGDATRTLSSRVGELASKFASWLSVSQVIMTGVRAMKNMVSESIELNDAMTQLRIVTNETEESYSEFGDTIAKTAQKIGAAVTDLVDSTTTYARLGYDLEESSALAEYTSMLQNVGDIDVSDAQDAITSMIKAFDISTDDIESVMDKLVAVGNNYPISVSQIAEGMTNASSALAAAGNSVEQSIALLTAANTTIQDASKSSTGLRTIAARIRNTTTELDELGETMTEASYEELVQQLTDCNVALTDANGEYRSTYDIMSDIAAQWEHMTSMEQAALATAMSGTRQQAVFYSIIEQFQEASGAMDTMSDSAGTLEDSYAEFLESTTAHINSFKAAFTALSGDLIDTGALNTIIDFGTGIINVLDSITGALGGLPTMIGAVTAALSIKDIGRDKTFPLIYC